MGRALVATLAAGMLLAIAACNAANQGATGPHSSIPGAPEPGSPAAQMQQQH